MDDTNPQQEQEEEMTTEENLRGDSLEEKTEGEDVPAAEGAFKAKPHQQDKGR